MLAERLRSQLLSGPRAPDAPSVVERLLAVQGQDPRGARLAIRARTSGLTVKDFDRALSEDRSLLVTWVNRGTLHLVRREDYPWLHALTTPPQFTANARRLGEEGVSPEAAERGVAAIERSLVEAGPLSREQLRERIAGAGVRTEGQALAHLLILASLRGITVRGPMIGGKHCYALVRDWLGVSKPPERERALAELARRYLAGHSPAADRDLARWAGLALRDARAGLSSIAGELREREDGLVELAGTVGTQALPAPRLLGSFDPVLLGWASREFLVGAHQVAITVNGIFHPFALVRGRAVGIWKLAAGKLALELFGRLGQEDRAALDADAEDVVRYLGLARAA